MKVLRTNTFLLSSFWAAVALSRFFTTGFSYNRWDNFEYFTPTLLEAHRRWLGGAVPLWSSHQHLGESLLASSQAGLFYIPYTLGVALVDLVAAPGKLMAVLAVAHLSFALVGWACLLERFGVRRSVAVVCAISIVGGGFVELVVPVWTFVGGFLCWMPWILYGALAAIKDTTDLRAVWLPVGMAMSAFIGYPQLWVYTGLWTAAFLALVFFLENRKQSAAGRVLFFFICGALLSSLALLPVYISSLGTVRSAGVPLDVFIEHSVPLRHLWSYFLPTIKTPLTFFFQDGCVSFFQGSWMPLVVGGVLFQKWDLRNPLFRMFLGSLVVALLFTLFSLGHYAGVYPLTHGIPLWSSFRWPFKFLLFANTSFAIAAGLALEIWYRKLTGPAQKNYRLRWAAASIVLIVAIAILGGWGISSKTMGALFIMLGIASVAALMFVDRSIGEKGLLGICLLTVVLTVALTQKVNLKKYDEPLAAYGPSELNIDPLYRVLPMSGQSDTPLMQPLGLFQSASLNGYDSATGCTTHLVPAWYRRWLPSNEMGLLTKEAYEKLLASNLLKSLNVKYVLVGNNDQEHIAHLRRKDFRLLKRMDQSSVFEQDGVLPRIYFATRVFPFTKENMEAGLLKNQADQRTAYLFDFSGENKLPAARVLAITHNDAGISAQLEAPEGGLIVFSSTYYPEWSVTIDGKKNAPLFVNGLVLGAWVPPGANQVSFVYESRALSLSVFLFLAGIGLLGFWIWRRRAA